MFEFLFKVPITILVIKHHNWVKVFLKLHLNFYTPMIPQDIYGNIVGVCNFKQDLRNAYGFIMSTYASLTRIVSTKIVPNQQI